MTNETVLIKHLKPLSSLSITKLQAVALFFCYKDQKNGPTDVTELPLMTFDVTKEPLRNCNFCTKPLLVQAFCLGCSNKNVMNLQIQMNKQKSLIMGEAQCTAQNPASFSLCAARVQAPPHTEGKKPVHSVRLSMAVSDVTS